MILGKSKKPVWKPFPTPKISKVLQESEGFTFATVLDLNMGYYTIRLDPDMSKIYTIIFPWGKYSYLRLPTLQTENTLTLPIHSSVKEDYGRPRFP